MSNKRIFYACQSLAIYKSDMTNPIEVHGLQSVGITTTFNLEQVFEIGQLAIYENIETVPDIEVTTEKVLDGYPPIFLLATKEGAGPTLIQRSKAKCSAMLSIYFRYISSYSFTNNRNSFWVFYYYSLRFIPSFIKVMV